MIQDIMPYHLDHTYKPEPPQKDSFILYFEDKTCLLKKTETGIRFPTFAEAEELSTDFYADCMYLFSVTAAEPGASEDAHALTGAGEAKAPVAERQERYYLVRDRKICRLEGYRLEGVELFRTAQPQYAAFAGFTGLHLDHWYKNHQYCGKCGERTVPDAKERMLRCPNCNNMEFPVISPAVIIAVTDKNRILLSKYAGRTYKRYALLAGYTEIGETVEETVRREVMEEVGLRVKNIRYYKSQPWGLSGTLLMGFYCELDGPDEIRLDEEELALAEWFEREEIPVEPMHDTLTNEMIMQFKGGGKQT